MRKRASVFVASCVMIMMDPNVRLSFLFCIMEVIDDNLSHIVNICQLQPTSRVVLSFLKDRITHFKIGIIANEEWVTRYIDQDFHKQFR